MNLQRFGTEYGGFYYPADLPRLGEDSVVYCFGAGEDITHDVHLSWQLNCPVHIFDPTPRAIDHVVYVRNVLKGTQEAISNKRYGGGDAKYWQYILDRPAKPDHLRLYTYGLYTRDEILPFYFPINPDYVSCSLDKVQRSAKSIQVPVKTLQTIMRELGHERIDLLKLDIENVECDVLDKMLDDGVYPTYLAVDFDLIRRDRRRCEAVIQRLILSGYSVLHSNGQDMSFYRGS